MQSGSLFGIMLLPVYSFNKSAKTMHFQAVATRYEEDAEFLNSRIMIAVKMWHVNWHGRCNINNVLEYIFRALHILQQSSVKQVEIIQASLQQKIQIWGVIKNFIYGGTSKVSKAHKQKINSLTRIELLF